MTYLDWARPKRKTTDSEKDDKEDIIEAKVEAEDESSDKK